MAIKTKEQIFIEAFRGLSLAETVVELRNLGVRVDEIENGLVVLRHPMMEPDYEFQYPGVLILVKGR